MPSSKLSDYEVISSIGKGSHGVCRKVKKRDSGKIYVWKELNYDMMSETEKHMLVSEVNLLRELRHNHIVRYYDRIVDKTTTTIYIIMEYCAGGDLEKLITRQRAKRELIDEEFVWKIFHQIALALKACHRCTSGKAVLHRDIKPANVFLDAEENVKLGDFGLARILSSDSSFAQTFVGTPYYMSPEQVSNVSYNDKSDVWSLGCLLYELCALAPPFLAPNQQELARKIRNGLFHRIPAVYSDDLNNIIRSMLTVDDKKRPSIINMMSDPRVLRHTEAGVVGDGQEKFSSSDTKMQVVQKTNEILQKKEEELSTKERRLERREEKITEREKKLDMKEKRLMERQLEIERKEMELKLRLNAPFRSEVLRDRTNQKRQSRKSQTEPSAECCAFRDSGETNNYSENVCYRLLKTGNTVHDRLQRAKLKADLLHPYALEAETKSKYLLGLIKNK